MIAAGRAGPWLTCSRLCRAWRSSASGGGTDLPIGWRSWRAWASARAAPASTWARDFSDSLARCGFAADSQLDSRDAQRLERWNELLDEFAVTGLRDQAHGRHGGTDSCCDRWPHAAGIGRPAATLRSRSPTSWVIRSSRYDGIWVLGLSENRWPRPPRPNPFVPLSRAATLRLAGGRRHAAPGAGALGTASLGRAHGATGTELSGHGGRCASSSFFAAVRCLGSNGWTSLRTSRRCSIGLARLVEAEAGMPAVAFERCVPGKLRNGVRLLELQQQCAFRAQAQLRLGADATIASQRRNRQATARHAAAPDPGRPVAGIPGPAAPGLRSMKRNDSRPSMRCWQQAVAKTPRDRLPADPRVMAREALRTRRILLRVLDLETRREPFRVQEREQCRADASSMAGS